MPKKQEQTRARVKMRMKMRMKVVVKVEAPWAAGMERTEEELSCVDALVHLQVAGGVV